MSEELRPDDVRSVWQSQAVENAAMSLEEIRRRAQQFRTRIQRRNLREYLAAVFVVVAFTFYIYKFPNPLIRAGSVLIIAGALCVTYQLHRRAAPQRLPADLALTGSLEFYRRELARQRDALQSVWFWYLLPFVPGLLVFLIGARPIHGLGDVLYFGMFAAVFYVVWWVNRRAARRLSRQIAELDSLEDQS